MGRHRLAGAGRSALAAAFVFVALVAAPYVGAESRPSAARVILISLDGTRPADLQPERLPSLVLLSSRGLRAERMIAARPTNTFPNHVTLVTGVTPQRHGIVNNTFVDPEKGLFRKQDIPEWIDVEPLWSILERNGIATASFYWVGSEGPWPGGRGPRDWKAFSSRTQEQEKVDQILAWLDRPDPPRFITSWFHGADHAGHRDGPDSAAAIRSLRQQDEAIANLLAGLEARGLLESTLLLFVSDHGMLRAERTVNLGATLESAGIEARVLGIGGFASLVLPGTPPERAAQIAQIAKLAKPLGIDVFARASAPAALQVDNPRFGDAVAIAPPGTAIIYDGLSIVGFHGYDPDAPSMAALFVAVGPGVEVGRTPRVRALDVAPTVLSVLGLEVPEWMEGKPIREIAGGRSGPAERSGVGR